MVSDTSTSRKSHNDLGIVFTRLIIQCLHNCGKYGLEEGMLPNAYENIGESFLFLKDGIYEHPEKPST